MTITDWMFGLSFIISDFAYEDEVGDFTIIMYGYQVRT
jgi:hypothetical protein